MKKTFIVFLFELLFFSLSISPIWALDCNCELDAYSLTNPCPDKTPSDCPSGQECQCMAEPDPAGTGLAIGCYPGTCQTVSTATPGSDSGGGVQPTPCDTPAGADTGIMTALGCIPTQDTGQFIAWLVRGAVGIGGGIAFLLMIFAGFRIITSSGDPQKIQAGKELLTSAIAGLLLIIFAVFLLELIGVRILNIPGFG